MISKEIIDLIKIEAKNKGLRLDLVMAIVQVESGGNTNAMRYEKSFGYYTKPEFYSKVQMISLETEKALQRFSYGLMQIIGGTARYLGYEGRLIDLCLPSNGIMWGCHYLANICDEYLDLPDQIAVYNAGRVKKTDSGKYVNQDYVDKVMALINQAGLETN